MESKHMNVYNIFLANQNHEITLIDQSYVDCMLNQKNYDRLVEFEKLLDSLAIKDCNDENLILELAEFFRIKFREMSQFCKNFETEHKEIKEVLQFVSNVGDPKTFTKEQFVAFVANVRECAEYQLLNYECTTVELWMERLFKKFYLVLYNSYSYITSMFLTVQFFILLDSINAAFKLGNETISSSTFMTTTLNWALKRFIYLCENDSELNNFADLLNLNSNVLGQFLHIHKDNKGKNKILNNSKNLFFDKQYYIAVTNNLVKFEDGIKYLKAKYNLSKQQLFIIDSYKISVFVKHISKFLDKPIYYQHQLTIIGLLRLNLENSKNLYEKLSDFSLKCGIVCISDANSFANDIMDILKTTQCLQK